MSLSKLPGAAAPERRMKVDTVRDGSRLIVDIHGMRVEQARFRLESVIENCNAAINEIVVIHGCNRGQALKNMVREELKSPVIKLISASLLNDGQTVITLRRKK